MGGISERLLVLGGMWFTGSAAILIGAYLLFRQKAYLDSRTGGLVRVEIPWLGKLKTNYPALLFPFLGTALILYGAYRYPLEASPTIPISGRISLRNGHGMALVPVGIVSGSNRTFTDSDGQYSVRIVRQEGEQYWAVAFVPKGDRIQQFDMRSVAIDDATGRGFYNHVFDGDGR